MDDYCYGAAHEIYAGAFSKDFVGLSFTDVAESVVMLRASHLLALWNLSVTPVTPRVVRPHRSTRQMRPIATDGVACSVSRSVMIVSPAKRLNRS